MKYRIKHTNKLRDERPLPSHKGIRYIARRDRSLPVPFRSLAGRESIREWIRFWGSFEDGVDRRAERKRRRTERRRAAAEAFRRFRKRSKERARSVFSTLRRLFSKLVPSSVPRDSKLLFGGLCGALSIALISAITVFFGLFSRYMGSFRIITVGDYVGKEVDPVTSDGQDLEFILEYAYSDSAEAGIVIDQTPEPGVKRKLFSSGDLPQVKLTVSRGRESSTVAALGGLSLRDASLVLKNAGIPLEIEYQYSDTAPKNSVISTSPAEGETVFKGDKVKLTVSLGKKRITRTVPALSGLGESVAVTRIEAAGFKIGKVEYVSSTLPAGSVISQSPAPYASAAEGSIVSLKVSLGEGGASEDLPK